MKLTPAHSRPKRKACKAHGDTPKKGCDKCRIVKLTERALKAEVLLEAMTVLRDSWRKSATEIAADRDMWHKAYREWMERASEAERKLRKLNVEP